MVQLQQVIQIKNTVQHLIILEQLQVLKDIHMMVNGIKNKLAQLSETS